MDLALVTYLSWMFFVAWGSALATVSVVAFGHEIRAIGKPSANIRKH